MIVTSVAVLQQLNVNPVFASIPLFVLSVIDVVPVILIKYIF